MDKSDLFKPISQTEAFQQVYAQAKYYPRFIRIYIPDKPIEKLSPNLEARQGTMRVHLTPFTTKEDLLERSLRRTKRLIADYALCNPFDLFATFTFSPQKTKDRADTDYVKTQMANWLKNQQSRNGKFQYLIVPEFHKDHKSLHFHALLANYPGKLVKTSHRINGRKVYHFKSYKLGINSAVYIDNPERVSSYIRKYITKDMPQFSGKHRFWATNGLKRPLIIDNPDKWYLHETPLRTYNTEYGLIMDFPVNSSAPAPDSDVLTEDSTKLSSSEQEA